MSTVANQNGIPRKRLWLLAHAFQGTLFGMRITAFAIGVLRLSTGLILVFASACEAGKDPIDLTAAERAWLDEHAAETTLALDPRWMPDQQIPDQRVYRGIIEDYVRVIEGKLGVTFKRFEADSWDAVLEAEAAGLIDIHPVLFATPGRSRHWLFTEPYIRVPMVVIGREEIKKDFSLEKMKGLSMAVGFGYGIDEFARTYCGGYRLVPVESDLFGLIKTSLGEIDLMIVDLASATRIIRREGLTNLRLVAKLGSLYEFSFASRKEKPILHEVLKKALQSVTAGERDAIYDRWIGFAPAPFYRTGIFWAWAGVAGVAVGAVMLMVLTWNRVLQRRVAVVTRDLVEELQHRRRAEDELRDARDRLEDRVQERTAALAEANHALEREIAERRKIESEILDVSNRERARIGRDLHDSLGQQLVGVSLLSKSMESRVAERDPGSAQYARKIVDLVESSISQTRYIVQGLMPVDIVEDGLVLALEKLAEETTETSGIPCRFDTVGSSIVRDNALALNLFHIVQEAVNNATKHAQATRIDVSLAIEPGQAMLVVADDGCGIKPDAGGGMGLKTMRYRADLAGGTLQIDSSQAGGTSIVCRILNPAFG
jgi:signal transduction histidine kinase